MSSDVQDLTRQNPGQALCVTVGVDPVVFARIMLKRGAPLREIARDSGLDVARLQELSREIHLKEGALRLGMSSHAYGWLLANRDVVEALAQGRLVASTAEPARRAAPPRRALRALA